MQQICVHVTLAISVNSTNLQFTVPSVSSPAVEAFLSRLPLNYTKSRR